jgi:uncharacterized OB-fold protein
MSGPDSEFEALLAAGELHIQHCRACGKYVFYPRLACTGCGRIDLEWRRASGRGTVYAVSVINRREDKGGPYNVVLVDLEEGPRMMSCVLGVANEEVRIGMPVKCRIDTAPGTPHVVFEPA